MFLASCSIVLPQNAVVLLQCHLACCKLPYTHVHTHMHTHTHAHTRARWFGRQSFLYDVVMRERSTDQLLPHRPPSRPTSASAIELRRLNSLASAGPTHSLSPLAAAATSTAVASSPRSADSTAVSRDAQSPSPPLDLHHRQERKAAKRSARASSGGNEGSSGAPASKRADRGLARDTARTASTTNGEGKQQQQLLRSKGDGRGTKGSKRFNADAVWDRSKGKLWAVVKRKLASFSDVQRNSARTTLYKVWSVRKGSGVSRKKGKMGDRRQG